MGSLTNKQQQLITALEVISIEDFISCHFGVGRPTDNRAPIARAFIAKAIYGHTATRQLLDQLGLVLFSSSKNTHTNERWSGWVYNPADESSWY